MKNTTKTITLKTGLIIEQTISKGKMVIDLINHSQGSHEAPLPILDVESLPKGELRYLYSC